MAEQESPQRYRGQASTAESTRRFVVSAEHGGQRLDRVVASVLNSSRSQAKVLIDQARVVVNGEAKKAGYCVRVDDKLWVDPLPAAPTKATPQAIHLDVLYEDEVILAINKPSAMVVHPAPGQWHGTVVNALLFRWGWDDSGPSLRPGILHRLDKDTSGVLLVAKDEITAERLARQFQACQIHKTYGAVAVGHFRTQAGQVELPIGRHPTDRKKMSVHARHSRSALSRYQVVAEAQGLSFVHLFPETGRTHQIRVHMAALGHPLVGDQVYGPAPSRLRGAPVVAQTFSRQALHAEAIRFYHPVRERTMTVRAPYPPDMRALLSAMGCRTPTERGAGLN